MTDLDIERIRRKPVLNGLINEYTHAASRPHEPQVTCPNRVFERDRFGGGAWDRTGRGRVAGNRPGDGDEDQGVTLSSAGRPRK
jgi:hypothetical protein